MLLRVVINKRGGAVESLRTRFLLMYWQCIPLALKSSAMEIPHNQCLVESQEEEVKLVVANCLPFVVASPTEKHQRAVDLMSACLKTAVLSNQEEAWQMESHATSIASSKAKLELSQADLQRFVDCLLRPDKVSGLIKVPS